MLIALSDFLIFYRMDDLCICIFFSYIIIFKTKYGIEIKLKWIKYFSIGIIPADWNSLKKLWIFLDFFFFKIKIVLNVFALKIFQRKKYTSD